MTRRTFLRTIAGAAAAMPLVAAGAATAKQSWSLGYIARQDGTCDLVSIAPAGTEDWQPLGTIRTWHEPPTHPNCRCVLAPID